MSRVSNDTLIVEEGQSLSSDWISKAIPLDYLTNYTIQLAFDGIIAGNFYLECSSGKDIDEAVWTLIDGSNQVIDEAGDHTWDVRDAGYKFVRVCWAYSGGTGNLTFARFNAKGI